MKRFTHLYGAGPAHAALLTASLAFVGYLGTRIAGASHPWWIVVWLAGAIVAHDLVLFPLYTAASRVLLAVRRPRPGREPAVPWRNHVRVPAVISGTLLLVSFPLVTRISEHGYRVATGLHTSVYLGRWLTVTGGLFGASALVYAARRVVNRSGPATRP